MNINEAFNITRPLTQEEQETLNEIAIDLAKPGTLFIQDEERPLCLNCGRILNLMGACGTCGRVMERGR